MAWQAFSEQSWRLTIQGMGVVTGADTWRAAERLRRLGMDGDVADDLLAACEVGMVRAYNEKDDADGGHQE